MDIMFMHWKINIKVLFNGAKYSTVIFSLNTWVAILDVMLNLLTGPHL